MTKKELIQKWLDYNLNPEEQKAFEALDDYKDFQHLSDSLKGFKSPNYDVNQAYSELKSHLNTAKPSHWFKPLLKIAAVILISLSLFYFNSTRNTEIETSIAQEQSVSLPDASTVNLNALSQLKYNKKSWSDKREVNLNGEAFFKVAKGSKFDVITSSGKISVLGTEFNVKQRENYFEVTCYEGLVAVSYNSTSISLKPGHRFTVIDGVVKQELEHQRYPSWINNESSFYGIPLKYILNELERHYNISIQTNSIDLEQSFTGSFTHNNLELALKSICMPLSITYTQNDSVITLKGE